MIPIASNIRKRLQVVKADITTLAVDAIVTSADAELKGGGAVDAAVHRVAGPALRRACRKYVEENGRCFAGGASITPAFNLPARYVIHAVGPMWCGGNDGETALLARAYARSLELARMKKLNSVAFCSISTGNYKFPKRTAALVALNICVQCLEMEDYPQTVVLVVYDDENKAIYDELLEKGTELAEAAEKTGAQ